MIRYCITDRTREAVSDTARRAIDEEVDMIQVREKDLDSLQLFDLVSEVVDLARGSHTRVLVNDRLDVALATGADGVHLPARGIPVAVVRPRIDLVGVSTHTIGEVRSASAAGADFIVFGPVFETPGKTPTGLVRLGEACRTSEVPVLAIGGMTPGKAPEAMKHGAAGVAGIRMFQPRRTGD